jgi:hypothetical protein
MQVFDQPTQAATRPQRRWRQLLVTAAWAAAAAVSSPALAIDTFNPLNQPVGWVTRPVLTSFNVAGGQEVLFRADFRAGTWHGGLVANYIDASGYLEYSSPWVNEDAAAMLDALHWDTGRRIVTRSNGVPVPFRWNSLVKAQQDSLNSDGGLVLNYLRGSRADENPNGKKWRTRSTVLGAIQHSTLLHWRHDDGRRRLYVGANDGMLHVFDATTGGEIYAYVPSMLIPRLREYTQTTYAGQPYVDGPLTIADVQIAGARQTLLVGGLGGGGQGLFALNVGANVAPADTEAIIASKVIRWEITNSSAGFSNLGHTYAMPRLSRLNSGQTAVVVGNGYRSANGTASLFLINAADGSLIRELVTIGGTASSPNGLSSPTLVDTNGDGRVDIAYAGDLYGNLWKFDLSASSASAFSVSRLHAPDTTPPQAITVAPVVHPHPLGGRMVLFGTGRTLSAADVATTSTATHYAYGIWDGAPADNTALLEQSLTVVRVGDTDMRHATTLQPNWNNATGTRHRGWRTALPGGERVLGESPYLNEDRYYFTSMNPSVRGAAGEPEGLGWTNQLHYLTGGGVANSVFDVNDDGVIDERDKVADRVIISMSLGRGLHSQSALADTVSRSVTLFNQQSGLAAELPPPPLADRGVSGGHFDLDLFDRRDGTFRNRKHVHEYDDKFDVVGANFLNPSDIAFRVSNAITSPTAQFKVLVTNQYLSPATHLSVGGAAWTSVRTFGGQATATDAGAMLASMPVYTRNDVGTLGFRLPLDAFASKDWWGDGVLRAGLIPSQTGCVNKVSGTGVPGAPGQFGEIYNGAMTIQLISPDTQASEMELNNPSGGPKYGWRVKYAHHARVLAVYTVFWHHPNGRCYGQATWTPTPPQQFGAGKSSTAAAGSDDPKGSFASAPPPAGVSAVKVTTVNVGDTVTTTTEWSDGKKSSVARTDNKDGTETIVTIDREGNTNTVEQAVGGRTLRGADELLAPSRRITWREVVRP